ncbi:hypothetical protein Bfae_04880 [Brachybacterium faecium DSM 4810]|uniref:Uncharacterized protein n=1 Tax=Brachybacterium faecium (strain ATCC 43885 / DSM 4810 / JCM 11609 / LMG 19847 / NBRC 14762 / NCIMB 9860 / 6-10) TaxID=446465 RepID=C7MHE8_BRAFD|nr:hypothetical protein [Brachybacterium faecium]ACU84357.1 hypothetical protein Bfae_04880 [Brachybacterium faecium DSM 4810]
MELPALNPLDTARARFPSTPDTDAEALQTHAEDLAALRDGVDRDQLHEVHPAMIFDPRTRTT